MSLYRKRIMRGVTAGVTTAALVLQPQLLVAAETASAVVPTPSKTVTVARTVQVPRDVVLQDNGVLVGRIVDARGVAVAKTPVSLQTGGKEVVRVVSDDAGRFEVKGLKGGVYRLWAPQTAPPAAAKGLSIISQPDDVVRGQYGSSSGGPLASAGQWIAEHPIMTAAGVAAAIAIPIALADDDDDPPPATP